MSRKQNRKVIGSVSAEELAAMSIEIQLTLRAITSLLDPVLGFLDKVTALGGPTGPIALNLLAQLYGDMLARIPSEGTRQNFAADAARIINGVTTETEKLIAAQQEKAPE